MAKNKGEGRAPSEKAQRVLSTPEYRKAQREKLKREEQEWAEKSGPVEVRRVDDPPTR